MVNFRAAWWAGARQSMIAESDAGYGGHHALIAGKYERGSARA
jgi:hypothetical protein